MSEIPTQKQLIVLGGLLSTAFREIRMLGWQGEAEQAAELADAICQLPLRMYSSTFHWKHHEDSLNTYQQLYPDRKGTDYVAMLKHIQTSIQ